MDIKEQIFYYISTLESQVSYDMKKKDDSIDVRFTTFSNKAGCKAVYEIIESLDEETKSKVLEMMKNRNENTMAL